jgi:2-polyprenyl-3-methyl-5-hydroxy-6-metoxy-1,4-benzoquinol methylase
MNDKSLQRISHWNQVYQTKPDAETSWFQDEPRLSMKLITSCAPRGGKIIDIGGGSSVLGGRLVVAGFDVTVLDVSAAAIERAKVRNGEAASQIRWMVADVTEIKSLSQFDVWHDRAVFHFLTDDDDRKKYTALAARSVLPGGHLVIGTFAIDGPEQCSGLPVQRYDDRKLMDVFAPAFTIVRSVAEMHVTPWGKSQSFFFAILQRVA